MEALFFGESGRQIYGVFHETSVNSDHGVVLAYPAPQEYMQSHYAFRRLATQLARSGLPVLRFDWHGTGDSAGDSGSGSFERWREDLRTAVQELKDISGVRKVSVVGFRIGASVAATTMFVQPLHDLVLWEPVLLGRSYIGELRGRERRNLGNLLQPPSWWQQNRPLELLGHTVSDAHFAETESMDLSLQAVPSARRIHVVANRQIAEQQSFVEALKARGLEAELDEIHDDGSLARDDGSMVLAGPTLAHIVDKLKAV